MGIMLESQCSESLGVIVQADVVCLENTLGNYALVEEYNAIIEAEKKPYPFKTIGKESKKDVRKGIGEKERLANREGKLNMGVFNGTVWLLVFQARARIQRAGNLPPSSKSWLQIGIKYVQATYQKRHYRGN